MTAKIESETKMEALLEELVDQKGTFVEEWNKMSLFAYKLIYAYFENDDMAATFKKTLKAQETNEDKVRLILKNDEMFSLIETCLDRLFQNCQKSEKGSKKGDEKVTIGDEIESCTKDISQLVGMSNLKTDEKTSLVSLLCQRATKFYELGYYEEALNDIITGSEYAVINETQYQDFLKDCQKKLEDKPTAVNANEIRVKLENKSLQGATAKIEMTVDNVKGRFYRSTVDIERGTVIAAEEAFVVWLLPSLYHAYCNHCLKRVGLRYFSCLGCNQVRYCSVSCLRTAADQYHSTECPVINVIKYFAIGHMALRMLIIGGPKNALRMYKEGPRPAEDWAQMGFGNNYESVFSLEGEDFIKDTNYLAAITMTTAFVTLMAQRLKLVDESETDGIGGVLFKHIAQIFLNTFTLYDENIRRSSLDNVLTACRKMKKIGTGLYGTLSLFSHSCDYSAIRHHIDNKIIILAMKGIKAGEEVTISYGTSVNQDCIKKRKEFLEANFGFDCSCESCRLKVDFPTILYKCKSCKGPLLRLADGANRCVSCTKTVDGDKIKGKLKEAEKKLETASTRLITVKTNKVKKLLKKTEKSYKKYYYHPSSLTGIYNLYICYYYIKNKPLKSIQYAIKKMDLCRQLEQKNEVEELNLTTATVYLFRRHREIQMKMKEKEIDSGDEKWDYEEEEEAFRVRVLQLEQEVKAKELFVVPEFEALFLPALGNRQ